MITPPPLAPKKTPPKVAARPQYNPHLELGPGKGRLYGNRREAETREYEIEQSMLAIVDDYAYAMERRHRN